MQLMFNTKTRVFFEAETFGLSTSKWIRDVNNLASFLPLKQHQLLQVWRVMFQCLLCRACLPLFCCLLLHLSFPASLLPLLWPTGKYRRGNVVLESKQRLIMQAYRLTSTENNFSHTLSHWVALNAVPIQFYTPPPAPCLEVKTESLKLQATCPVSPTW